MPNEKKKLVSEGGLAKNGNTTIYAMIKFPNKTIFVRDVNGKQSVTIEGEQEITQQEKEWIMDIAQFIEDI